MLDYIKEILKGQFEAALCMVKECVEACPPEQWEGMIASVTFRQVAYHTLFWTDVYLSKTEQSFELREIHRTGGDERNPFPSPGLDRATTLVYAEICSAKVAESIAAETAETMQGPCGFSWRRSMTRGELHLYNLRHVQHHTGQLSAYLRRINSAMQNDKILPWIATGWRKA